MIQEIVARVQELFSVSRIEDARALLEAELARGAGSAPIFTLLGYAHLYLADPKTAQKVLEEAVAKFPDDASAQEGLARVRWINGAGAGFADQMIAAVAQYPGSDQLRLKCADLLRLAGQYDNAERVIREGLSAQQDNASLRTWLGILLDETGRLSEAELEFQAALKSYPGHPTLHLNLAHTLLRQGKADAALEEIAAARRSEPGNQLAITYTAMALKQKGDDRFNWLCDYQNHVQVFDVAPPPGFQSMSEFNSELAGRLRTLHAKAEHPLEQSLRGGSQTNQNLIFTKDPVVKLYLTNLRDSIGKYIVSLPNDPRHPLTARKTGAFSIAGCWSVLLRPDGFHVNHTHPLGWISSAYYVSLPDQMSSPGGQEGWIKFGEPRWPVPGVGIERVIEPKEGRLVLFPSYMWHGTIPFSKGERLTAPFDVVPSQGGVRN